MYVKFSQKKSERRGNVLFAVLACLELEVKSKFLIGIFENAEAFQWVACLRKSRNGIISYHFSLQGQK